jgi:transposase
MKQRAAIKYCFKLGKSASETYELLQKAYGSDSLSRSMTFVWFKRFREGRESLKDDERSGRPTTSRNEQTIGKVQQLVMQDRHITLRMLSVELNVSKDTIREIMCDDLEKKKMCAKFVPHLLTPEQKTLRIESCGNFVEMVEKEENMLSKIVTGDETWYFMYDPMTKWQSCEWVSPKKLKPSKVRMEELRVKTMFVFFDSQGVIHREFVPEDQTVNGQFCLCVMEWLLKRIHRIRPKFQN